MMNLSKWPLLLVSDAKVSKDLATEIIIRTSSVTPCSNDHAFEKQVHQAFGVPDEPPWEKQEKLSPSERGVMWHTYYEKCEVVCESLGMLDLEYLKNWQIASSYIDGPHGWIDWKGNIGCKSFNIGKWPSCEEILREWELIASTWPELNFRTQLINDEGEADVVAIEFIIDNGKVRTIENPTEMLQPKNSGLLHKLARGSVILNTHNERGCTITELKRAIELTKQRVKNVQ